MGDTGSIFLGYFIDEYQAHLVYQKALLELTTKNPTEINQQGLKERNN